MRLFIKRNSPYSRIAWIAALEAGLEDEIELVEVTTRDPESSLLRFSPVGQVPTLETRDGQILGESIIITGYFDSLHDGPRIVPGYDVADLPRQALRAIAMGFMEGVMAWIREAWLEPNRVSERLVTLEHTRAARTLATLEKLAATGRLDDSPTIEQITLASVFGYCDAYFPAFEWRQDHPNLVNWYDTFAQRPSMQKTWPLEVDWQRHPEAAAE